MNNQPSKTASSTTRPLVLLRVQGMAPRVPFFPSDRPLMTKVELVELIDDALRMLDEDLDCEFEAFPKDRRIP
jgi:hypothetical protein